MFPRIDPPIKKSRQELWPIAMTPEELNCEDGYQLYHTAIREKATISEIARRMESMLGRYVNPDRIEWIGDGPKRRLRATPGQVIQIKWGQKELSLEVSLEKPLADVERWARSVLGRVCTIRHECGWLGTDGTISGGDRLVVSKGQESSSWKETRSGEWLSGSLLDSRNDPEA
jgi:hypothetical protein